MQGGFQLISQSETPPVLLLKTCWQLHCIWNNFSKYHLVQDTLKGTEEKDLFLTYFTRDMFCPQIIFLSLMRSHWTKVYKCTLQLYIRVQIVLFTMFYPLAPEESPSVDKSTYWLLNHDHISQFITTTSGYTCRQQRQKQIFNSQTRSGITSVQRGVTRYGLGVMILFGIGEQQWFLGPLPSHHIVISISSLILNCNALSRAVYSCWVHLCCPAQEPQGAPLSSVIQILRLDQYKFLD